MKTLSGTWQAPSQRVQPRVLLGRATSQFAALYKSVAAWLERYVLVEGCVLYLVAAVGLHVSMQAFYLVVPTVNGWAIYWPFNGVVVAVLLMNRRRWWPWILAGVVSAFAHEEMGWEPFLEVVTDGFANLSEILIVAFLLPPFRSLKQWMMEPYLVPRFIATAIFIGPAFASIPVAFYFNHAQHLAFWPLITKWGFADALGSALWVPLVFILFSKETYLLLRWPTVFETIALVSSLYAISWLTFRQNSYPIAFLPTRCCSWSACGWASAARSSGSTCWHSSRPISACGARVPLMQSRMDGQRSRPSSCRRIPP